MVLNGGKHFEGERGPQTGRLGAFFPGDPDLPQNTYTSVLRISIMPCPHGRSTSYYCKPCGGAGICTCGIPKPKCRKCGGSVFCPHDNKRRSDCRLCNPEAFCEHGTKRYYCVPCGGKGICPCGHHKSKCKKCGGGAYCAAHGKLRTRCAECGGGTQCRHGWARRDCEECTGLKRPAEEQDVAEPEIVPHPAVVEPEPEPEPEPEVVAEPIAPEADDVLTAKPAKKRAKSRRKPIAQSVDAEDVQAMLALSKAPVRRSGRAK